MAALKIKCLHFNIDNTWDFGSINNLKSAGRMLHKSHGLARTGYTLVRKSAATIFTFNF